MKKKETKPKHLFGNNSPPRTEDSFLTHTALSLKSFVYPKKMQWGLESCYGACFLLALGFAFGQWKAKGLNQRWKLSGSWHCWGTSPFGLTKAFHLRGLSKMHPEAARCLTKWLVLQTFKPVSCSHKQFSHSLICRFHWETGHVLQQQMLCSLQPHSPGKAAKLRLRLTLHIWPLLSKFLVF